MAKAFSLNQAVDKTIRRPDPVTGRPMTVFDFSASGVDGSLPIYPGPLGLDAQQLDNLGLSLTDDFDKATPGYTILDFLNSQLDDRDRQYITETWRILRETLGLTGQFNTDPLPELRGVFYGTGPAKIGAYEQPVKVENDFNILTAIVESVGFGLEPGRIYGASQWAAYRFRSYIHETLHSLGLDHPGAYNGSLSPDEIIWTSDSWNESIMSYIGPDTNPALANTPVPQAVTPRTLDYLALDRIYGSQVDSLGRRFGTINSFNGDTRYGFNTNIDATVSEVYSGMAALLGANDVAMTVVDNSGVDTFDFSGYAFSSEIDLRVMTGDELRSNQSALNGKYNKLSLAVGTIIENVIGGDGADKFYDNASDNKLTGRDGDDMFWLTSGSDSVDGGDGFDIVYLSGKKEDYTIEDGDSFSVSLVKNSSRFTAKLKGVEKIVFSDGLTSQLLSQDGDRDIDVLTGKISMNTLEKIDGSDLDDIDPGRQVYNLALDYMEDGQVVDKIIKFTPQDRIDLRGLDGDVDRHGFQSFDFIGSSRFSGDRAEIRYRNGVMAFDFRDDSRADMRIRLKHQGDFDIVTDHFLT